ncbi:MAG: hypothetical protein HQL69_16650 [Magnetococcales bacterium]|nr:hypothetical protein [Magnetococcales bacterium]
MINTLRQVYAYDLAQKIIDKTERLPLAGFYKFGNEELDVEKDFSTLRFTVDG